MKALGIPWIIRSYYMFWLKTFAFWELSSVNILDIVSKLETGVMLIHGTKDNVVPFDYSLQLWEALNSSSHSRSHSFYWHNRPHCSTYLENYRADPAMLQFFDNNLL